MSRDLFCIGHEKDEKMIRISRISEHFTVSIKNRGRRGRDGMLVGFTITYAISVYYDQGKVYNIMW